MASHCTAAGLSSPAVTLEQLKTFLYAARLGGVRRAAQEMNLSQPAVSARLAALETSLGVTLFARSPRGVSLTNEGALLLQLAEQLVFVHDEIRARLGDPAAAGGLIRIGAAETIAQSWLPAFVREISEAFPRSILDLTVDISVNLRDALVARQLDLALLMGPVSHYGVENIPLPDVPLTWLRRPGGAAVDFRATPVLSYSRQTRPYREVTALLLSQIGPGVRVYPSASLSASIKMIAAGIGVGAFPADLAVERIEAGEIEPFDPGFCPGPLVFTASYSADPRNVLIEQCAALAAKIAARWNPAAPL